MQGRHQLALGVEGELADARCRGVSSCSVDARLSGGHDDGTLGGVPEDAPVPLVGRVRLEKPGVAALRAGREQLGDLVRLADDAFRFVADPGDRVAAPGLPEGGDGHLGFRQGPGLVRADDSRRPERLDRGEPLDKGMAGGHPPHRDGQGHRQGGGQALGYQRHHDAQGEHEAVNQPGGGSGGAQAEDECGQRHGHRRHLSGHPVDVALQRAGYSVTWAVIW